MKSKLYLLIALVALVCIGCEPVVKPTISVEPNSLSMIEGDTATVVATVTPASEETVIEWASSNPEVATVDANGVVVAVGEGTANISATIADVEPAICQVTVTKIPSSFPRKFLMEHFTGDQCGYCPDGMFSMVHYLKSTTVPHIWVSHHHGYNKDEYTISESSKVASVSQVNGAPNMAMNRTKITGTSIAYHPSYMAEDGFADLIADKCATESEASVVINHTYDASSNQLEVTVSGLVSNTDVTEYLLSVLIKENGLVGKQADYIYSWKGDGYREFLHPCVIRGMLTAAVGDTVKVEKQRYRKSFTYTVPVNWVAENCCVVAYITPLTKRPIINAEETPLVVGTTGGAEYLPYAITEVKAPNNATKLAFSILTTSKPSDDKLQLTMVASSSTRSDLYGPLKMVVHLEFNTSGETIPEGTYNIAEGNAVNTLTAGTTDMKQGTFGGSYMAYVKSPSLETDTWEYCHYWRMKEGTMTVDASGNYVVEGTLYNGKRFGITYTKPVSE